MLDSHPDILGGPEFHHLPDILKLREKLYVSISKGWITPYCSYDEVDNQLCSMIEKLLLPLADKYGAKFLSEKTPGNVEVFEEILELFPAARLIHVIRDPRAIIASMLKVGKRAKKEGWSTQDFTHSVPCAISFIKNYLNSGFKASRQSPDRIFTICYESLVTDPESELKRLCDFLHIKFSNSMLRPAEKSHIGEQAITNDIWYTKEEFKKNPVVNNINKWKTQLTLGQKIKITNSFNGYTELEQLGYNFTCENFPEVKKFYYVVYSIVFKISDGIIKYIYNCLRFCKKLVGKKFIYLLRGSSS